MPALSDEWHYGWIMSIVSGMTGWWSMSIYLKNKKSHNLGGWWSVDLLLIEMKTFLIWKEKSHLYSFIHSSAIWCVLEFHGLYRPWGCKELDMTERLSLYCVLGSMDSTERNRPGASLCLSVLEFHINGITPYALCWLFKNSEWYLAVIRGVACTSSFLSSVVSLCIVVSQLRHASTCCWMFGLFLVWGVWIRLWGSFMAKLFGAHCARFSWLCTWE